MIFKRTKVSYAVASALVFAGGSGLAFAQQPTQKIEKIEVTGTNIKRVDTETAAPIEVITSEDLRRSGATTVAEALRNLPSNSALGGLNALTGSNSFSAGASSISLRGLGSAATLVLLNGRRVAPYGLANPNQGQSNIVNVEALPLDVIERIEVLKDGASAIYGSEAMAGVVNIILRKDYKGAQAGGSYSINNDGKYRSWTANTTVGFGDLAKDRFNVFVNFEHTSRERTAFKDVENFLNRDDYRNGRILRTGIFRSSYAGNYYEAIYDPATNGSAIYYRFLGASPSCPASDRDASGVCRFSYWPYLTIEPKSDRNAFFARGQFDVSANLSLFGEASVNQVKTEYQGAPQVYGDFGSWYAANLNAIVNVPEVLPVGHPNNPYNRPVGYRHRFTEIGGTGTKVDVTTSRMVFGAKGTFGSWDWESAALYAKSEVDAVAKNQIRRSVLTRGILNGTYNFLNPSAGQIKPTDLTVDSKDTGSASYKGIDFKVSSELAELPGGPLGFAAGIEYRKEDFQSRPDKLKGDGEIVGYGAASADGDRNVTSVFAEVSVPIIKMLEAQVAVRTDKYSDYGRSTTPKVGLKFKPLTSLAFRATYAEGFRAPSLSEISKSSVSAFTTVVDPRRCITGEEEDCNQGIGLLIEANPSVKPEESKSFTFGMVFEPVTDFSLSLDYFHIRRTNEISTLSLTSILANELSTDPRYAGRVVRGPVRPDQPDLPGPIQVIKTGFYNLGKTKVTGMDMDIQSKLGLGTWGKLKSSASATYYFKYESAADSSSPMFNYAGLRDTPRFRAKAGTSWEYSDFVTSLTVNYVGRQSAVDTPNKSCAQQVDLNVPGQCTIKAWTTLDLGLEYRGIKNLRLSAVARNIQNKPPVLDPTSTTTPGNLNWNNPYGRYFTFSANYKFM